MDETVAALLGYNVAGSKWFYVQLQKSKVLDGEEAVEDSHSQRRYLLQQFQIIHEFLLGFHNLENDLLPFFLRIRY